MAVSEDLRNFVLDQVDGIGQLTSKRMFGGVGFWCDGLFFALISGDGTAYLKVDDSNREAFEKKGMSPFRVSQGRVIMLYFEVPPDVLEDSEAFARWALKSVEVARQAEASHRTKKQ